MPITNFPNGISALGIPVIGSGTQIPVTSGSYIFVCSLGGASGSGSGSFDAPYTSLVSAVSAAVDGTGAVIVCMPGHAETITSATGMLLNKSGIQIVGIGTGALVPTFTLSTANTSTIAVSSANVSVTGCKFVANFLSIAACFTLSTAINFGIYNNLFVDTSGVLDFLNIVKSTGAANTIDGVTAIGNTWTGLGTTSVNTFLLSANDINLANLQYNTIVLATTANAASLMILTAGILTNASVGYNKTYRNNTTATVSLISVGGTTSTGIVNNNYTQTLDTGTNVLFATTVGLAAFNNYITGVKGASGFIIPAIDS